MPKLRSLAPLVRTFDTRTTRLPPRQKTRSTAPLSSKLGVPMWSSVQGTGARLSTMAIGAARHGPSTACMRTTSLNCVMVVHHLTSTMDAVCVHLITRSKQSRLEQGGLEAE
jgi:hypothetical protein